MRLGPCLLLFLALHLPLGTVGGEIAGLLRDNHGNGLGGITLTGDAYLTTGYPTQLVATTEATGAFKFAGDFTSINVESSAGLNARGYLSVASYSLTATGQTMVRLTTRKLDFTHRIHGRLVDEANAPLAGYTLRASIEENNAHYATNVVTDTNGAFTLAAVPALWSITCPNPPTNSTSERLFGEYQVEVEVNKLEQQATLVAPTATATLTVTASNMAFYYSVALTANAFGTTYRLLQQVPYRQPATLTFRVFDGPWTVSVTNAFYGVGQLPPREVRSSPGSITLPQTLDSAPYDAVSLGNPPPPVSVVITNGTASVFLGGVPQPDQPRQTQAVRIITASGQTVRNANVYSNAGNGPGLPGWQLPGATNIPSVYELSLPTGRWHLTASTETAPEWIGWRVSRQVVITASSPPPEITLVLPDPDAGPRIYGTVRDPGGAGLPSRHVSLARSEGGTNYSYTLHTDSLGCFSARVLPGRWLVQTRLQSEPLAVATVVSNQDAEVNLELLIPASPPVPVNICTLDEDGLPQPDSYPSLSSGPEYLSTNGAPCTRFDLRPGIWGTSLNNSAYANQTPTYVLYPSLTWQLSAGAPTNLTLPAVRTTARIEGRLRDEQGRLLQTGYASAWTSVNGTNFWANAAIASGYFSLNVFPGDWQVGASVTGYSGVGASEGLAPGQLRRLDGTLPTNYYTRPPTQWVRVAGGLARCEFVTTNILLPPEVPLAVTIVREDHGDPADLEVVAYGSTGSDNGITDENGMALLQVPPGRFTLSVRLGSNQVVYDPLTWPNVTLDLTAPSNHVVLVVRQPSGYLSGTLQNAPALGVQPEVFAYARIDGTNYSTATYPDITGRYRLPVLAGESTIAISDVLSDYGIQSVPTRVIMVPPTGNPAPEDFVLAPMTGDFREGRFLTPVAKTNGTLTWEFRGAARLTWQVERSTDLIHWTPATLQSTSYGSFIVETPFTDAGTPAFYRAVWVR